MSKVTMTIEDLPGGGVKIVCEPSFEQMMMKGNQAGNFTSAEGYAIFALNQLRAESKKQSPTRLIIPKLARA